MPPTRSSARQEAASQPAPTSISQRHQPTQHHHSASQPNTRSHSYQQQLIVPGPDDSDFLDSEADMLESSDRDGNGAELDHYNGNAGSSRTTTSASDVPMPIRPLVRMAPRVYFAVFPNPAPDMLELSAGDGSRSVLLPPADTVELEESGPRTRGAAQQAIGSGAAAVLHRPKLKHWEWLNVDQDLPYLSFFDDWGPLNIGMFWRFCTHVHQWLIDPEYAHKNLVVYTSSDPHRKANAALLMALWALVIEKVEPADAFYPFSTWEFEPFRDAGYGRADFNLSIQDCIYGLHRGIACGLLDLSKFDIDEYEYYEQVQHGDWNWITPNFIAFASPNDKDYVAQLRAAQHGSHTVASAMETFKMKRPMSKLMTDTIRYFRKKNVKLVVRLNNPLYDKKVFEDAGIRHVDMYFDDGSNPSTEILREFIKLADEVVKAGGVIAVHCKAGLGRTGVLIGAYLIWSHGFTANEVIGFMRLMRPGCVVGPQQHFMYTQFVEWVRWGEQARLCAEAEDTAKLEAEKARIEAELEQSRREVEAVRRQLAEAQALVKGGLESAKADEAARMRLKRKSSSEDKEDGHDDKDADVEAGGPVTPRPHKMAHFASLGGGGDVTGSDAHDSSMEAAENFLLRTAPAIKPPPVVGQPRKSPSPSRKRVAQRQAPATQGRLGSMRHGIGRSLMANILSTAGVGVGGSGSGSAADAAHQASSSSSDENGNTDTPTHSPALGRKGQRSGAAAIAPVRTSSLLRRTDEGDSNLLTSPQRSSKPKIEGEDRNGSDGKATQGQAALSKSGSSGGVKPLMQSLHAGNVQLDHNDIIVAARSMLTHEGKLLLSPKENTINAYVRTGGMTIAAPGSGNVGSTTPKSPPPLPTPVSGKFASSLLRSGGRERSIPSLSTAAAAAPAPASAPAPAPASVSALPEADDVFSSPPAASLGGTDAASLQGALPLLSHASPKLREQFMAQTKGPASSLLVPSNAGSVTGTLPQVPASTSEVRVVSTRTRPTSIVTSSREARAGASAPYVRPGGTSSRRVPTVSTTTARSRSTSGSRPGTQSTLAKATSSSSGSSTMTVRARVPSGSRSRDVGAPTARKASSSSVSSAGGHSQGHGPSRSGTSGHSRSGSRSTSTSNAGSNPGSSSSGINSISSTSAGARSTLAARRRVAATAPSAAVRGLASSSGGAETRRA
ncbi:hypothetical protein V8E36_005872 [Tilletia maclaganii]